MNTSYHISDCGDHAVTIAFGDSININVHHIVMAFFKYINEKKIIGIKDIIPAYCTVTIVYDVAAIRKITIGTANSFMRNEIEKAVAQCSEHFTEAKTVIEIPVCYHASVAPDLAVISKQKDISEAEIIKLHTRNTYTVYMLGFLPGFAYMDIVDDVIATPRLSNPRTNVKAGSVGIAGNQTGIYSLDSPGGWNIIGQTPLRMFDASKNSPCLLKPGDTIKFTAIDLEQFNAMKNQ